MATQVNDAKQSFAVGTSRTPLNRRKFAIQMAMEIERLQDFADRLRALRGPKPQPVVAAEVGVGLRTYQFWEEAAHAPEWENLVKLANVFKVSENYLLYGEEEPQGPQTQLDRVEAKIDHLIDLLAEREPGAAAPPKRKRKTGT